LATAKPNYGTMIHVLQGIYRIDTVRIETWRAEQSKLLSGYGTALHLDRRAFDEALALAARDAGADLKLGCNARFTAQPGGGYMVQLSG
jgi:flavin-dependent dehydrogenase